MNYSDGSVGVVSNAGNTHFSVAQQVQQTAVLWSERNVLPATSVPTTHPLKLTRTADNEITVLYGTIAGRAADSAGTFFADGFVFTITGTGTKTCWCEVTMTYDSGTGIWSSTACELFSGTTPTAASATKLIVNLGTVTYASSVITDIYQNVPGSQWIARVGNSTAYVDHHGS